MDITETNTDGLKREFKIVVPASDLDTRLTAKLEQMKGQVQLKGFRPGKVPVSFLKKTYGKAVMSEILEEIVTDANKQALEDRGLRPALDPKVELDGEIADVVAGKSDLAYTMAVEILPEVELTDLKAIELERMVADVDDKDVTEAIERIAADQKAYVSREDKEKAQDGDRLTIDFTGDLEGEPFEGGSGESVMLVIGSNQFIPGFEEQLSGAKKGDEVDVNVTFPDDYQAEHLAGKKAHFAVTVQDVAKPEDIEVNDEFAKQLGLESLDKLQELMRERIKDDYARMSRMHLKRTLLDALDETHKFDLPEGMVEAEFGQIWAQVMRDLEQRGKTIEDEDQSEEEMKAEYRGIAERRVRLGLVLSEVGRQNNVQVASGEVERAIMERARQFPGQEKQVLEFYQKNPAALQEVRAPLFEDKVVDFILELAKVSDKTVSKDELFADPEEDEKAA